MGVRVYVLLDIVDGYGEDAIQLLQDKSGVMLADRLEGRPDVIIMVEAPSRQKLAEIIMPAIGCVADITEDLHLLVTRQTPSGLPLSSLVSGKRKVVDALRRN